MTPKKYIEKRRERINAYLEQCMQNTTKTPKQLHSAMRYMVCNGGKRIRPLLTYATGEMCGASLKQLDAPASSIELIHTFSLIHDDLPAMDNDDLRRGKPTCHKAYNEAIAILAGDALQAMAFEILTTENTLAPELRVHMAQALAKATGAEGMAGGQSLDLEAEHADIDLQQLETLHRHKTGALIACAIEFGAITGKATPSMRHSLTSIGYNIGLAFQIQDDILDIESTTETLGKTQGADIKKHKATFPTLLGLDGAKRHMNAFYQHALEALKTFDDHQYLEWIIESLLPRKY